MAGSKERYRARAGEPPRLKMVGVTKRFPGVLANDNVQVTVKPGEIHALLGENGAGKSTLVKMIYGILAPDAGEMFWDGEPVEVANPRAARKLGIGMVFQHFSLFEALTVLENIALGVDAKISQRDLEAEIRRVLDLYGLKLDPHRIVTTLSVGERQRIEIVRALLLEPAAVDHGRADLGADAAGSRAIVRDAAQARRQRLLNSLHLAQAARDHRALRHRDDPARRAGGRRMRSEARDLQEHGRADDRRQPQGDRAPGRTRRSARRNSPRAGSRCAKRGDFGVALKDINFSVRAGEILGVAGVAGNGQNQLMDVLSGEVLAETAESIVLEGKPIGWLGPTARRGVGLCAVPEERNGHAAVGDLTLALNGALTARRRMGFVSVGLIREGRARKYAERVIGAFSVKALGAQSTAGSLSGGNLQKFVVGPRDPAGAGRARGQPADVGGRCGRRGRDTPGDRRSGRAAAARSWSSRRTSTNCWSSAIRWW